MPTKRTVAALHKRRDKRGTYRWYVTETGKWATKQQIEDFTSPFAREIERQALEEGLIFARKPTASAPDLRREGVRNRKGRFVSKKEGKVFRTSLGETVPMRFGTATGEQRSTQFATLLEQGELPKADATSVVTSERPPIYVYYWRFEGLDSEEPIKDLIRILRDEYEAKGADISVRYSVGTGWGGNADWTGSHFNTPSETYLYFSSWNQNSPSAQEIFKLAEQGNPIWFEVEAQIRGNKLRTTYNEPKQESGKKGSGKKGSGKKGSGKKRTSRGSKPTIRRRGKTKKGTASNRKRRTMRDKKVGGVRPKRGKLGKVVRGNTSKAKTATNTKPRKPRLVKK